MWGYRCRCVITGNGGTSYAHLGRPWGPFGRVVFAYTYMDACIKHVGWNNWGKTENERSACFYEYRLALFIPSLHISAAVESFSLEVILCCPCPCWIYAYASDITNYVVRTFYTRIWKTGLLCLTLLIVL